MVLNLKRKVHWAHNAIEETFKRDSFYFKRAFVESPLLVA